MEGTVKGSSKGRRNQKTVKGFDLICICYSIISIGHHFGLTFTILDGQQSFFPARNAVRPNSYSLLYLIFRFCPSYPLIFNKVTCAKLMKT